MTGQPPPQVAQITPGAAPVVLPDKHMMAVPSDPAQVAAAGIAPAAAPRVRRDAGNGGGSPNFTGNAPHRQGTEALYRPSPLSDVVQRSPFVSSSPYDRIVAPPPLPPPTARDRRAAAVAPKVTPRPQTPDQRTPSTAEAPVAARPTPPPVAASAPTRDTPTGAPPGASLAFLQWSADPDKRVVSIKVGTGPAMLAHEGDSVEGLTVVKIRPDAVELRSGESRYLLKAR